MARKKNPIKDIGETVGGWLNSAAKSTDVFLKGDQNPFMATPARRGIAASQQVGDALSGGLVSAAKKGGDAFGKQLAVNAVTGAAISGAGAGVMKALRSPAVRNVVSEYTPVLRKTMLDAVDAERKIARQAFQKEADLIIKKANKKTRRVSLDYMDLYEESSEPYKQMVDESNLSNMSRAQINKKIIDNAQVKDILDLPYGPRTNESYARAYLRAKAGIIRDAIPNLTPEQKKKALESQLGKSILRRQGPK